MKIPERTCLALVLVGIVISAIVVGCSETEEPVDIEATVEARVATRIETQEAAASAIPEHSATPSSVPVITAAPTPVPTSTPTPMPTPEPTSTPEVPATPDVQSMISAVLTAIPPTKTPTPDYHATAVALATLTAPTPTPTSTPTPLPNFGAINAVLARTPSPTANLGSGSGAPVATPIPSALDRRDIQPSGRLTIAVDGVGVPEGLPRFCTDALGGCSEIVYLSGMTETLFNTALDDSGLPATEPMLATEFKLDPSLEYGDFRLREGVLFHNGMGEMTSEDVAFTYNDANSVTNPESVHGQAGDFASVIASMDPIDPYTVRLQYRNYDSRGVLHRFSRFWQTAGIVSSRVFAEKGVDGMRSDFTGVGAFRVDEWVQQKHIRLSAFADYYARGEGNIGPYVQHVEWRDIPAGESRRAALQIGEVQIAQIDLADLTRLTDESFVAQRGGGNSTMFNISMGGGNYWEEFGALTGEQLERNRDGAGTAEFPHIGNPFQNGSYDEHTPSMESARLVREALAWGINREKVLSTAVSALAVVNHQPYLSVNNPNYREEWSWGTDFDRGRLILRELGYRDGLEIDLWIGDKALNSRVGEAIGSDWRDQLNVNVNLVRTKYDSFRPALVARTNRTMFTGCGDENKGNFPYDWAHGFTMSSISVPGPGAAQEIPFAAESYLQMAGEPDKAKREQLAAAFFDNNRHWALCVGVFEYPNWPLYNPGLIAYWDQRPSALSNLGSINNVRTIALR